MTARDDGGITCAFFMVMMWLLVCSIRIHPITYLNSESKMSHCRLRHAGCSFLVAGRKDADTGVFMTLRDVQVRMHVHRSSQVLTTLQILVSV